MKRIIISLAVVVVVVLTSIYADYHFEALSETLGARLETVKEAVWQEDWTEVDYHLHEFSHDWTTMTRWSKPLIEQMYLSDMEDCIRRILTMAELESKSECMQLCDDITKILSDIHQSETWDWHRMV